MRIYTFYSGVKQIDPEGELKLILLWRAHHAARGFEPVVLNEFIARQHPYFEEYSKAVGSLPNINPAGYEFACFARWLALAQAGGGLMCDYDVFWMKRPTDHVPMHPPGKLRTYEGPVPSCVAGYPQEIEQLCREFASGKIGKRMMKAGEHFSDMYGLEDLLLAGTPWIEAVNVVRHYSVDGWNVAPIVHFAHVAMTGHGPRWKAIPNLLSQHANKM